MATEMEVLSAISQLGFESLGNFFFGTWNGYAVTLRKISARIYYLDVAVRLPPDRRDLRKALAQRAKAAGLKLGGAEAVGDKRVSFTLGFSNKEASLPLLRERLDAATDALRALGIWPAASCAITGAPQPDSLCLVKVKGLLSYQPVLAAAVRESGAAAQEKAEENELNGSYALGVVGAVLGVLVGLIPNLLTIFFADMIYSLLFALVPICAMFGYKLFRGKMTGASIVIVILLSLLAVPLIPVLELVFYLVKERGFALGQAFSAIDLILRQPDVMGQLGGELVKLLAFMGLGIWVAWRFMSNQTNRSSLQNSEAQLASLRPNPAFSQQADNVYRQY